MKVCEIQEYAWTPEIGGVFTDLKLKLKPFLLTERKKMFGEGMALKMKPGESGKMDVLLENPNFSVNHDQAILDSVLDWDNLIYAKTSAPIPCTPENKIKYLGNLADQPTGHKIAHELRELEEEPGEASPRLNLFAYISEFTAAMENFEGNSQGTASDGNNGGKRGAGKATIISAN